MGYRSLRECVDDLESTGQLVRIEQPVDPHLEAAEIHRRVQRAGGPAIYYARVDGCRFPMVSNLLGSIERARFLFRDSLRAVARLIELKIDPARLLTAPWRYTSVPWTAWCARPGYCHRGTVLANACTIDALPQQVSWPRDGGAFITLPLVYTEHAERPGLANSNLGMYRVQISGGQYARNREVGLHYQIHRGIGVHHQAALRAGLPLRVSVMVGGPPALILAAVMPAPEGLSELVLAGALGRRRVHMVRPPGQLPVVADADFAIVGTIDSNRCLPEGPFGDHLGYYSLEHPCPVLRVERVFHRHNPIWPFTVVGRPPQEDSVFGQLIHELTEPIIPSVLPGVDSVHAVDAAGVHPLLLAIGSERYTPYAPVDRPQELLTQANALLGQGQLSLAKYLMIVARNDDADLQVHDIRRFFQHLLERIDWRRDLHFQTRTTIDTLDYSGSGLNQGSKLIMAAVGPPRRSLPTELPADLRLPAGFAHPRIVMPGIVAIEGPPCDQQTDRSAETMRMFCQDMSPDGRLSAFPLAVMVDDSRFAARSLENFLWVTFTRSNPAADVHGVGPFCQQKHWGCRGCLVIDARIKPHHAPPLLEDPQVTRRVDRLAAPGGPLHGILDD